MDGERQGSSAAGPSGAGGGLKITIQCPSYWVN